ncbi:hypothetical protein [Celeribacter sp. PS-C1]|uniref:hypothetical protein n=1 Tax=Celeribacter sp. PS-C1 TaxID=2820813 RepID=UPI001CA4D091|nr:hypothetical protein [Celeribacter sp. PS-C1]MBW6416450.1 hypothetical protein [Celeribacter sp. PS-C1]
MGKVILHLRHFIPEPQEASLDQRKTQRVSKAAQAGTPQPAFFTDQKKAKIDGETYD